MVFNVHFQLDVEMCVCSRDVFAEETDLRADTVFVYLCICVFLYLCIGNVHFQFAAEMCLCSRDVFAEKTDLRADTQACRTFSLSCFSPGQTHLPYIVKYTITNGTKCWMEGH